MSLTAHDRFFGFIHSFKLNRNNFILGGKTGANDTPYPAIINRPNFGQVLDNWNQADTGLVLTFFVLGIFVARRRVLKDITSDSLIENRNHFKRYHRIFTVFGLSLALRNSAYRLQGYVPNGLPQKEIAGLVKYDYSTEIINGTFWKYFIEPQARPTQ